MPREIQVPLKVFASTSDDTSSPSNMPAMSASFRGTVWSRCPANTVTDQHLSHREQADIQPGTCRVQVCTASRVTKSVFEEPVGKMESSRFSVPRGIKTGVSIFLPTPPLPLALNTSPMCHIQSVSILGLLFSWALLGEFNGDCFHFSIFCQSVFPTAKEERKKGTNNCSMSMCISLREESCTHVHFNSCCR